MAITFVAAGAVNRTAAESLSLAIPAGTSTGDLLIAFLSIQDAAVAVSSAGWTAVTGSPFANSNGMEVAVLWRLKQAGDTGPWSFTTVGSNTELGLIAAWTGTHQTTPIGNVGGSTSETSSVNAICPTITVQAADNMVLAIAGSMYGTTWTAPTGSPTYTERVDALTTAAATGQSIHVSEATYTSTGATGTKTCVAANADFNKAVHLELQLPAGGAAAVGLPPSGRSLLGVGL